MVCETHLQQLASYWSTSTLQFRHLQQHFDLEIELFKSHVWVLSHHRKVACLLFKQYSGALLLTIQCLEVQVVKYREDCDAPPDIVSRIERGAPRMRITGAKLNISARMRRRWAQRWLFKYLTSGLAIFNLWKGLKDVNITDGKKGNSTFTRWPKELETPSGLVFHWNKIRGISCIAKHEFRFKRSQLQILGMPRNQLEIPSCY